MLISVLWLWNRHEPSFEALECQLAIWSDWCRLEYLCCWWWHRHGFSGAAGRGADCHCEHCEHRPAPSSHLSLSGLVTLVCLLLHLHRLTTNNSTCRESTLAMSNSNYLNIFSKQIIVWIFPFDKTSSLFAARSLVIGWFLHRSGWRTNRHHAFCGDKRVMEEG